MIAKLKTWALAISAVIASLLYFLRVKDQRDEAKQEQEEAQAKAEHLAKIVEEKEKYYKKVLKNEKEPAYHTDSDDGSNNITLRL